MGSFHILSVYLHLLQADRPVYRKELVKLALQKNEKTRQADPKKIPATMAERTKNKSKWAREQLIALASIRKNKSLDLKTLRGSYAGAFGLPQFIPSSYLAYAQPYRAKAKPNLQKAADAIMSVGNYLAKSGWDSKDRDAKIAALMMYNNSRDYAESILAISQKTNFRNPAANSN
jgi:membrane-bound lytic murein transglycosylase B